MGFVGQSTPMLSEGAPSTVRAVVNTAKSPSPTDVSNIQPAWCSVPRRVMASVSTRSKPVPSYSSRACGSCAAVYSPSVKWATTSASPAGMKRESVAESVSVTGSVAGMTAASERFFWPIPRNANRESGGASASAAVPRTPRADD